MKTIKLNINCSEETCSVDVYMQCRFGHYFTSNRCRLFGATLKEAGVKHTPTTCYMDYYRCKECKEAEVNQ